LGSRWTNSRVPLALLLISYISALGLMIWIESGPAPLLASALLLGLFNALWSDSCLERAL
jgi:hypothetical protein